ncbi:hypothetical protein Tco_1152082 [Tanacetum coccineum]
MKRRKRTTTDQRWNRIMINDINQQLLHRRIMRSLEKFVGGRDYGTDYRLLQRTKDLILQAGNHVKEILLKLNLPDHKSVLTDPKIHIKMDMEMVIQDKERYEHVSPKVTSLQEGKILQDDDKRLDLVDDLKEAQDHIQVKLKEQVQV